jgi:phosphate transport system substrate-binding protein
MKKTVMIAALIFLLGAVLFGGIAAQAAEKKAKAGGAAAGAFKGKYPMGGSTTTEPIFTSAIEAFAKMYPDAKLSYDSQGSSVGVTGVIDGVYVIGGSSRELKPEELQKGAVPIPIALDGIGVIVNSDVAIDNLTLEQVARIFTGAIKNWKDVGGTAKKIVVVNRDEASGTRVAFSELVLHKVIGKDAKYLADAITVESNGDMVTKVGQTPDAIGYCGFGYVDQAKQMGAKVLSVDGVDEAIDNVLSGKYPISRKLYALSKGKLKAGTAEKAFVDFILSKDGQKIVEESGFIALP